MVRRMLQDVSARLTTCLDEANSGVPDEAWLFTRQHACLTPCAQPRQYQPLLHRRTCGE